MEPQRTESKPAVRKARSAIAGVMAALILLLAALAGRRLFLGEAVIEIHGYIGSFVFVLSLVNIGLVVASRDASGVDFGLAVAIGALTFAQVGLGYVGRETAEAAAWHMPNGVLLMSLSTYQFAMSQRRPPVPATA